jgi:hypothetical protein
VGEYRCAQDVKSAGAELVFRIAPLHAVAGPGRLLPGTSAVTGDPLAFRGAGARRLVPAGRIPARLPRGRPPEPLGVRMEAFP